MTVPTLLSPDTPEALVWLLLGWLFAVGACIGSFMNVVIYRLPAGLSLLHPPSRCPACETPIRATDNVPILGWLWLRGRCRHCHAAISPRYPAVELLTALLFAGLAAVQPLSSGVNLPISQGTLSFAQLDGIYAYHLFLLCSLTCAAFIEFDAHPLPMRLGITALIVGLAAPLAWPDLHPITGPDGNAAIHGLLGIGGGATLGLATLPAGFVRGARGRIFGASKSCDFAIALAWIGAFLGWQAAAAMAMLAATSWLLVAFVSRWLPVFRRIGLVGCLAPWTLIWITAWKLIVERLPWLGAKATVITWLIAVGCVAALAPLAALTSPSDSLDCLTGSQRRPRRSDN